MEGKQPPREFTRPSEDLDDVSSETDSPDLNIESDSDSPPERYSSRPEHFEPEEDIQMIQQDIQTIKSRICVPVPEKVTPIEDSSRRSRPGFLPDFPYEGLVSAMVESITREEAARKHPAAKTSPQLFAILERTARSPGNLNLFDFGASASTSQCPSDPGPSRRDPGPSRRDPGPSRRDPGPPRRDPGPSRRDPGPSQRDPGPFDFGASTSRSLSPHVETPVPPAQKPEPLISAKSEYNMFLMFTQQLLKGIEHIHFHPMHEYCTCKAIFESHLDFRIPTSTNVVKRTNREEFMIKVDVRFYEINTIFVRVKEDKIIVEATRKTRGNVHDYHHIYQAFSKPGKVQKEELSARIEHGELIIERCVRPASSEKKRKDIIDGTKQKRESVHPANENCTPVVVQQVGKIPQPKAAVFTKIASQNGLKLTLDVKHFSIHEITVNLIEDKIVIEAMRETHRDYEYHYLHRSVPMPKGLQESSLAAKLQDGILTIEGIVKPPTRVAPPQRIPWITPRGEAVAIDEHITWVPVAGPIGPYNPESSRFVGKITESAFRVRLCISKYEISKIFVRPKGKMITIEAECQDYSPFEYHSIYKSFELPRKVEHFDIKSSVLNKHLNVQGIVKAEQNNSV